MTEIIKGDDNSHESVKEYLPIFLQKYGVDDIGNVNCDEVSESDFERLGDAVMESNHPGEAHERMDEMMGGEGSETLEQMHINMGRSYLRCFSNDEYETGMGYMMRQRLNDENGWQFLGGDYIWGVNGLLVSVLLVVLIRYFWKKSS